MRSNAASFFNQQTSIKEKKSMKKVFSTIVLLAALSSFALAEGTTHSGGRSCPLDQTCLVDPGDRTNPDKKEPFYKDLFDYLKKLFA
jgi:hypothetical protein